MIPFNKPLHLGPEIDYIKEAIDTKISGNGTFTRDCQRLLMAAFDAQKVLLTHSGTGALEMAAMLAGIAPGDEVIMPSYTFSSTATAFVRQGAQISFVDIRPDTMNIDEELVEQAITPQTKALAVVHYAGVACNMQVLDSIATRHGLFVIEDAAQGVMSTYNGRYLGTLGHFGCYSFHETKNYTMGEGGALLVNNASYNDAADMLWEKGTNRTQFLCGHVDKYTWVTEGSSFLPSEINAAYLLPGLENMVQVNDRRKSLWQRYYQHLQELTQTGRIELPSVPAQCEHNAHMFYIKTSGLEERGKLIEYLSEQGIMAIFHYVPLHSSPAGQKYGRFVGVDRFTTSESERLVRLPLYYGLSDDECDYIVEAIYSFMRH